MSVGEGIENRHSKIFVGGVSIHTTDDGFKKAFAPFGEITDSIILRDPETNRSRGFGFVTFKSSSSVERVIDSRPINIDDREVEVKRAIPKEANNPQAHSKTNKVFIGGLPNDITDKELRDFFSYYGSINDIELIYKDSVFRGFGFITFKDFDSVDKVIVDGSFDLRENGHKCRVSKAGQRTPRQPGGYPQPQSQYGGGGGPHYGGGGPHYGGGGAHYGGAPGGPMQSSSAYYGGGSGGGAGGDSYYSQSTPDYNGYNNPSKGYGGYGGAPSQGPPSGGYDTRSYGGQGQNYSAYTAPPSGGYSEYGYGYGHGGSGSSAGSGGGGAPGYSSGGGGGGDAGGYQSYKVEGGRGGGRGGRARYKPY